MGAAADAVQGPGAAGAQEQARVQRAEGRYYISTISVISTISWKERARSNLSRVLAALCFSDWLVVYLVARNIDRALFTTLATVWMV